jgi:hypothetical protein
LKVKAGEGRREWCFDFVHGTAKREREREKKKKKKKKKKRDKRSHQLAYLAMEICVMGGP